MYSKDAIMAFTLMKVTPSYDSDHEGAAVESCLMSVCRVVHGSSPAVVPMARSPMRDGSSKAPPYTAPRPEAFNSIVDGRRYDVQICNA